MDPTRGKVLLVSWHFLEWHSWRDLCGDGRRGKKSRGHRHGSGGSGTLHFDDRRVQRLPHSRVSALGGTGPGKGMAQGRPVRMAWSMGNDIRLEPAASHPSNDRKSMGGFARNIKTRPPMPWFNLNKMHEADLKAVHRFIRYLGRAGKPPRRTCRRDRNRVLPMRCSRHFRRRDPNRLGLMDAKEKRGRPGPAFPLKPVSCRSSGYTDFSFAAYPPARRPKISAFPAAVPPIYPSPWTPPKTSPAA